MKAMWWFGAMVLAVWSLSGGAALAESDSRPAPRAKAEAKAEAKGGGKININEATKAELMKLEGVGAGTAQKIIAYREAHGPFKRVRDLEKVEGVGKGVLEKNAGRLIVK